ERTELGQHEQKASARPGMVQGETNAGVVTEPHGRLKRRLRASYGRERNDCVDSTDSRVFYAALSSLFSGSLKASWGIVKEVRRASLRWPSAQHSVREKASVFSHLKRAPAPVDRLHGL